MERAVDDSGCVFKKENVGLWEREPVCTWFAVRELVRVRCAVRETVCAEGVVRELMRIRGVVREPDVRAPFLGCLGFSDDISDSTDRADEFYVVAVINL